MQPEKFALRVCDRPMLVRVTGAWLRSASVEVWTDQTVYGLLGAFWLHSAGCLRFFKHLLRSEPQFVLERCSMVGFETKVRSCTEACRSSAVLKKLSGNDER